MTVLAAIFLVGCEKNGVELTPDEADHINTMRADPKHRGPIGAIVTEFGTEEGTGEVVSIDPVAQTVSLRHRQESREDWPRMVMTFRIRRGLIPTISPGDRVYFRALVRDGAGEILVIQRAPAP